MTSAHSAHTNNMGSPPGSMHSLPQQTNPNLNPNLTNPNANPNASAASFYQNPDTANSFYPDYQEQQYAQMVNDPNLGTENDPNGQYQDPNYQDPNAQYQDPNYVDPNTQYQDPNTNYQDPNYVDPNTQYQDPSYLDPEGSQYQDPNYQDPNNPYSAPDASDWQELYTDEGHLYYYNAVTGESSWEYPQEGIAPGGHGTGGQEGEYDPNAYGGISERGQEAERWAAPASDRGRQQQVSALGYLHIWRQLLVYLYIVLFYHQSHFHSHPHPPPSKTNSTPTKHTPSIHTHPPYTHTHTKYTHTGGPPRRRHIPVHRLPAHPRATGGVCLLAR